MITVEKIRKIRKAVRLIRRLRADYLAVPARVQQGFGRFHSQAEARDFQMREHRYWRALGKKLEAKERNFEGLRAQDPDVRAWLRGHPEEDATKNHGH